MTAPVRRAILCGIDQYSGGRKNLLIEEDLSAVSRLLTSDLLVHHRYPSPEIHKNTQLTWNGIDRILQDIQHETPTEELFFYLAGHGRLHAGQAYYRLFHDDSPGLALNELFTRLDQSPVPRKFVVLDFCHAGEVAALAAERYPHLTNIAVPASSLAVLAACAKHQLAPSGIAEPSMTQHFVRGALTAIDKSGRNIAWGNIMTFVADAMKYSTIAHPHMHSSARLLSHTFNTIEHKALRIAVLPFDTARCNAERFENVARSVIEYLSQGHIKVISWRSSSRYDPDTNLRQVENELGATHVITGRATKRAGRWDVSFELTETTTGSHCTGETWSLIPEQRLVSLGLEIALTSGARLGAQPHTQRVPERDKPQHRSLAASGHGKGDPLEIVRLIGRATNHLNRRTHEGFERSKATFDTIIKRWPNHAEGYAGRAACLMLMGGYGYEYLEPREAAQGAFQDVERALTIDPNSADAHCIRASLLHDFGRDEEAANGAFRHAERLRPHDPTRLLWQGIAHLQAERFTDAMGALERAERLDPHSLIIAANVGYARFVIGNTSEAADLLGEIVTQEPSFWVGHYMYGQALTLLNPQRAIGEFRAAIEHGGEQPATLSFMACAHMADDDRRSAEAILNHLVELRRDRYVAPFHMALVHAALGDVTGAIRLLDEDVRAGSTWHTWYRVHPMLVNLQHDEHFPEILKKAGESLPMGGRIELSTLSRDSEDSV